MGGCDGWEGQRESIHVPVDREGFCLPFLCHRRLEVPYMYMYEIRAFKSTYKSGAKGSACPVHSLAKKAQTYCCALTQNMQAFHGTTHYHCFEFSIGHGESQRGSSRLDIGPSAVCLIPLLLRRLSTNPEKYLHHEVQRRHRRLPRHTRHQRKCCC